jgi:hypothetical protein
MSKPIDKKTSPRPPKSPWAPLGLFILFLALTGLALAPSIPGLWGPPLAVSLIILPLKGPKAIRRDLEEFFGPRNRGFLKSALVLVMILATLLAVGSLTRLPVFNLAAPEEAVLPPETLALLGRLTSPVIIKARLARDTNLGPVRHLMDLYQRGSSLITTSVSLAEGQTDDLSGEISLAKADSVLITTDGFAETVSPISRFTIDRSLRRLLSPNRLVFNLMGDGEKSVFDQSPMGLSRLADSLVNRKIYLQDLAWPGPGLPAEALAANALLLSGPRTPLGEERQKALIDYVIGGGKLFILQDPMVAGFDTSSLSIFGLDMALGLVVDPEAAWAGTEDRFIVGRDFPAHPITLGLEQPVIWPLSGAMILADQRTENTQADGGEEEVPLLKLVQEPDQAVGDGEGTQTPAPAGLFSPPPGEEKTEKILFHTWAVAISSEASWLETDLPSIGRGAHRYQADEDRSGPLVLATATSVNGGGRLAVAADADLAANGFISYGGNLAFLTNTLFWLMGAEDDLPPSGQRGIALHINHSRAKFLFWIPLVFWPLMALSVWFLYYRRRRSRS